MKKKFDICNLLKVIGFLGYLLCLFSERVIALVLSVNNGDSNLCPSLASGDGFAYATYIITAISLGVSILFLYQPIKLMLKNLFHGEDYDFDGNIKALSWGCMLVLIGGMMHTGYTLLILQFVAYGFLILAMIIKTIEECRTGKNKYGAIISCIYLTCFSMSIPVCYHTSLDLQLSIPFYIAEFSAVAILVPIFGYMFFRFFFDGITLFDIKYPCIMIIVSGLTIGFKWIESINWFLLVFCGVTLLIYIIFGLNIYLGSSKNK